MNSDKIMDNQLNVSQTMKINGIVLKETFKELVRYLQPVCILQLYREKYMLTAPLWVLISILIDYAFDKCVLLHLTKATTQKIGR